MATTKRTAKKRMVYLAFTASDTLPKTMLAIYAKSSYQDAFNWLSDIADRHGVRVRPGDNNSIVTVQVQTVGTVRQMWWLEGHEVR